MANQPTPATLESERITQGSKIILTGFVLIALTLGLAVLAFRTADDVVAVLGAVTGVVGTVVGTFFGYQQGSSGKEKVEAERKEAQDTVAKLAGALPPGEAERLLAS